MGLPLPLPPLGWRMTSDGLGGIGGSTYGSALPSLVPSMLVLPSLALELALLSLPPPAPFEYLRRYLKSFSLSLSFPRAGDATPLSSTLIRSRLVSRFSTLGSPDDPLAPLALRLPCALPAPAIIGALGGGDASPPAPPARKNHPLPCPLPPGGEPATELGGRGVLSTVIPSS
jgi:hypothetical protein